MRLDQPIILDDFSMLGDGYPLMHDGKPIPLTRGQASLVWTLLKAYPRVVSGDTIMIRIGSEGVSNVLDVMVSRIRATMRLLDIPNHIETMHGQGFRWSLMIQPYHSNGGGRPPLTHAKGGTTRVPPSLTART